MSERTTQEITRLTSAFTPRCEYQGRHYWPCEPCGDSASLADAGDRLMFRHGNPSQPEFSVFVAPKGTMYSAFVATSTAIRAN